MVNKKYSSLATGVVLLSLASSLALAAPFKPVISVSDITTLEVKPNPHVKVGNLYEIQGITYKPIAKEESDEIGIASWYGSENHGMLTANGEVYDKNELTAAHPTLPLPSFVQVTNLENGKKIIVRINDRGPFASGRTIDLSERAALMLGFKEQGTAAVRVTLLNDISKEAAAEIERINGVKALSKPIVNNYSPAIIAPELTQVALTSESIAENDIAGATRGLNVSPFGQDLVSNADQALGDKLDKKAQGIEAAANQPMKTVNLVEPSNIKSYMPRGVFVQIGAFSDNNDKIKQQVSSLSDVGVVSLQKVDLNGKNILRLRVGPYGSIDDAIKVKNKLVHLGYVQSRVIIEQ
ncbi:Septal ring lytic transglycosylase RlpA family protein [Candidatus Hepatincolaceae symbiont of Richtersius coronifer]